VEIRHGERNLLGWPKTGEEAKLIVVTLSFDPIRVNLRDQRLGILDPEWVGPRTIFASHPTALKTQCRI
jgi:hypothetical protein